MEEATLNAIVSAVSDLPVESGANAETRERQLRKRVELAIIMAVNAPAFIVQR